MVVICLVVSYIIILVEFNKRQLPPDVLRDDINNTVMLSESNGVVGCVSPDQMLDVLERQAEMIRYLHEHTQHLGRKILLLTNQLGQRERVA